MKPFVLIALTTVIACQDQEPNATGTETEAQVSTSQLEQAPSAISESNQFLQYVDSLEISPTECTFGGEINYVRFVDKMMNPNKYRGKPAI